MKPEKKACPICGRSFIDKHVWGTSKTYCNLYCAEYAKAQQEGRKPLASLDEIRAHRQQTVASLNCE